MWGGRAMSRPSRNGRFDLRSVKDRIDLAGVAIRLLGQPPGRRNGGGARLWWHCPIPPHEDHNPSFCVDPGRGSWKCWGCGEHGDAIDLVMRLRRLTFPEAIKFLLGDAGPP